MMEGWDKYTFEKCIVKNKIGRDNQINASEIIDNGQFPVIDQGQSFIAGYTNEIKKVISIDLPYIVFGDHTRCFKYVDFPFVIGADGTKVISPNIELFDPKFFYFQLLSLDIQNRGYNRHFKLLKEKELNRPPLPEQRKIAHVLSTVQKAIEQQDKLIHTTTEMKKALMQKLFTEGTRGEPQKEKEIGLVPESWDVVSIEQTKTLMQYGTSVKCDYENEGVPVIRIPNVISGKIDLSDLKFGKLKTNELEKLKLNRGDLIFVRTNGAKKLSGRCAIFQNEIENCYYASYLIRLQLDNGKVIPDFLNYYTQTELGKSFLSGKAIRTADGKYNINTGILNNVLFPLPTLNEQTEIIKTVLLVEEKIALQDKKKQTLTVLSKTLLHELMTGQRRVHELEF